MLNVSAVEPPLLVYVQDDITSDDLYSAMSKVKNGKARGPDDIPIEVLRNSKTILFLVKLFNKCYCTGQIPEMSSKGTVNTADPGDAPRVGGSFRFGGVQMVL